MICVQEEVYSADRVTRQTGRTAKQQRMKNGSGTSAANHCLTLQTPPFLDSAIVHSARISTYIHTMVRHK